MSPKRGNTELSRSTSRNPSDSPGAAGTPHKRTMRRTASHLSPRKDQGELLLLSIASRPTQQEQLSKRGTICSLLSCLIGWQLSGLHVRGPGSCGGIMFHMLLDLLVDAGICYESLSNSAAATMAKTHSSSAVQLLPLGRQVCDSIQRL